MIGPRADVALMEGYHSPQLDVRVRLNTNESPEPPPAEWVAEVARAARKRRPNVPVLFLTGYADLTALGEFASEPILHKPFRDAELGKVIADMLKAAKPVDSAQADTA